MTKRPFKMNLFGVFVMIIISWRCAEDPLETDLSHLNLSVDTLYISNIVGSSYWVSPNIGTNDRLYLGSKNGIDVPVSFIGITDHFYWDYYFDSTVTFDSLHFMLFSNDSELTVSSTPNLYFSPDSHFHETKSSYKDFSGFSTASWTNLGQPNISINTDTSGHFTGTVLTWDVLSLVETLTDTLDSTLVRSFAIDLANSDTNFIKLYSREATSNGEKDPQIKIFFHQEIIIDADSTYGDTLHASLYAYGDVSIINPGDIANNPNRLGLSNGLGLRSLFTISFDSLTLPEGSLIRKANLVLPFDTTTSPESFTIIFEPIEEIIDSLITDSTNAIFDTDPYSGVGYPYRIARTMDEASYTISIKSFLQNITLGNVSNIGFKILSYEKNDPFESLEFYLDDETLSPKLEIIYVKN